MVDPDGRSLPPNTEGELQVRGCSVFAGYFDNDAANSGLFTDDGWLRTGDLAVMSESRPRSHHRPTEGHHQSRRREAQSVRSWRR